MERLTVLKVGGAVVEDPAQLEDLLKSFTAVEGAKILVHGGGRRATKVAGELGVETQMVNGRRITNREMLDVVTMVYGGLVNKNIVAQLQALGVNAIGLTGADGNAIRAHKRPVKDVDYGFVGDVDEANGALLAKLLDCGLVPVVAPLTHDGQGNLLNTNADTMAQTVATALVNYFDVTLVYSFEKKGVLRDADDENSVIETITHEDFKQLVADGTIFEGMIPKIENALTAVDQGVKAVKITRVDNLNGGTTIKAHN